MTMLKRRREQRTDYRQRLALLRSGLPRLVVRRTLNSFRVQVIEFTETGDRTVFECSSGALKKYGWRGHCGSIPAAYLTGLLAGVEAGKKGVRRAVADVGLHNAIEGTSLFTVVKGARDTGLDVPLGEHILPSKDRISGRHIAQYAEALRKDDQARYRKQFSQYIKNNIQPEKMHEHFEEARKKIIDEHGIKPREKAKVEEHVG